MVPSPPERFATEWSRLLQSLMKKEIAALVIGYLGIMAMAGTRYTIETAGGNVAYRLDRWSGSVMFFRPKDCTRYPRLRNRLLPPAMTLIIHPPSP